MNCLCRAGKSCKSKWGHIHLVDKCLLVILSILMLQSGLSLFLAETMNQETNTIDVVIRTSAASIFGYLVSANFSQHRKRGRAAQRRQAAPPATASATAPRGPVAQIGFQMGEEQVETPAAPQLTAEEQNIQEEHSDRAQILVVAAVGIISLVILVVYRNFSTMNIGAAAILTQFRDFVSGSVGFLIGCSTRGVNGKDGA